MRTRFQGLALVAVTVSAAGCFNATVGLSEPSDAGTGGDSGLDTDYDAVFDGDTDQCNFIYDTYSGNSLVSYVYGASAIETYDSQWNGESWDSIALLELYGAEQGDLVDLELQSQYETCDYCVLVFLDCPTDDLAGCGSAYMARSGGIHVISLDVDQPWDNDLEFAAFDVVMDQVNIDWGTYESTPVQGGDTICVGLWHVLTVPQLP